ncbi:MAG TPA: HEAT repeat domain-containing protein [Polyangia bacterium]|nr:HEAT repeat domain-containing protein [Polyangia bacterium]
MPALLGSGRAFGRVALALGVALVTGLGAAPARAAPPAPRVKVEELCTALEGDSNYKVRVQAAIVLGRLGDDTGVGCLIKALSDPNKTVRGIAAQALGQIGEARAADPLRALLQTEADPFVKAQADKALAALHAAAPGGLAAANKKARIYLSFGPFTGTAKAIGPEAAKLVHDVLQRELGKLSTVTLTLNPADQKNFAKSGLLGFLIDGVVTRLDDTVSGGSSETSCDVKAQVLRWPSKSLISWTNAGASVQSGSRPRDKENARHDCLEASAVQLAEDLTKFLKSQGG